MPALLMLSDNRKPAPRDIPTAFAGTGHYSLWTCAKCARRQYSAQGRKKQLVRGLRTWVCVGCAADKS